MGHAINDSGIEIHNKHPEKRKEKASLLFTRNSGGTHDGKFELRLDFEYGSITAYLDPTALADMLSHSTKDIDVFVHGTVDSRRKPKRLELDLHSIPKKFLVDPPEYEYRNDVLKYPRLRDYLFAALKAAGIGKAVISFQRSNPPNADKLIVHEIDG